MSTSDALNSVYRDHVNGASNGRFALLRALAARTQRGTLALAAARLRVWAAQAGLDASATAVEEDEAAADVMSAAQLESLLAAEELRMLHANLGTANDVYD